MYNLLNDTNPLIDLKTIRAACQTEDLSLSLFLELLKARKESGRDGNRRRLFAAFDALLAEDARPAVNDDDEASVMHDRSEIHLSRLSFRNWKVFSEAEFSFPTHQPDKPVVLVGGKNGYGKTSLLEGVLYCLFGRTAFGERSRLLSEAQSLAGRNANYRHFIERALHLPAKERGDRVATVKSEWVTSEGPFVVERRWYLDDDGAMSDEDEVLTIWTGADRDVLSTPENAEPTAFYQSEIERRLMSPGSAAFMLFDGEQVGRFSEKGFGEQVRLVTEGAFGLSVWNDVVDDLRDYARDRTRRLEKGGGAYEQKIAEIAALQSEQAHLSEEISLLEGEAARLRDARDAVLGTLSRLQGGTYDTMHQLLEQRHSNSMDLARYYHEFAGSASSTLPFALFGQALKSKLLESLKGDSIVDARHASIFKNEEALAVLIERISAGAKSPAEQERLSNAIIAAWSGLAGSASEASAALKHDYMKASLRSAIVSRLSRKTADVENVRSLAARIDAAEQESERLARGIAENEKREVDTTSNREELKTITADLATLGQEIGTKRSAIERLEAKLAIFKNALLQMFGEHSSDRSTQFLVETAIATAAKIDGVIAAVRPDCFSKIGAAVTKTYASLAHKQLVANVEITADGMVHLYDATGRDVRSLEASAGENQIFSMALMAAIGDIMPVCVPIIMDTPLGRLDRDHRERLLTYFAHRDVQTIMLSQPDEVNGIYLEMIEDRVATRFILDHQGSSKGPGATVAREGYFSEAAA
ncbi:hypothetical protein AEAC466_10665 [Asticcacaulis sp. AC466]|uniref:AAA family ATPase n=1 Tax=Asticcacaulis sp. AC466 TaxID=1282362 RepID=UPI0003C3DD4C|nr:AAA family ATPase [Asticcacaulis sp. AC466]ESQ84198.1 hypothetical protein AEAC466_10665 [Asticcacaulis sp. AC466]